MGKSCHGSAFLSGKGEGIQHCGLAQSNEQAWRNRDATLHAFVFACMRAQRFFEGEIPLWCENGF
jgi:hypothetical protein